MARRQEARISSSASGAAPADIAIDRDDAVTLTWRDGHVTRVPLPLLRERCPCARCQQRRRDGEPVVWKRPDRLRVAGAELVGAWGLGLAWSDGHATGVYPWDLLRSWCACEACTQLR